MIFLPLAQETGRFLYASNGGGANESIIIGFQGPDSFLNRMRNLLLNYQFSERVQEMNIVGDVWVLYGSIVKLKKFLHRYFISELQITCKEEIDWKVTEYNKDTDEEYIEITHNEEKLQALAKTRSEEFITNIFQNDSTLLRKYYSKDTSEHQNLQSCNSDFRNLDE